MEKGNLMEGLISSDAQKSEEKPIDSMSSSNEVNNNNNNNRIENNNQMDN